MPSSVVSKIQYIKENSILRIFYMSGAIYDYLKVPEKEYISMQQATSKGKYLNNYIKKNYFFKKIR